ncbi:MAG: aldehyde dehydrogenase [Rhizobiaceae bacterium]|nr:aldehyde dehydrogenase [Rhizobiaceae bacterium]
MNIRATAPQFSLPQAGLIVGGQVLRQASGGTHVHVNPADGERQAEVPIAGAKEVTAAVDAAAKALLGWRSTPAATRRDLLFRLSDLVLRETERFAWIGAKEVGTPIKSVRAIPGKFAAWTKYAAGWADKLEGRVVSTWQDDNVFDYTICEPFGVIGMIVTWNGPLMGLAMKVGPALAAGNTVVIKPPEFTPFTAFLLLQLAEEAGIPEGVLNLVTGGAEAGEALVLDERVAKVAFTGGTHTAARIAAAIAPQAKPALYELGGKSANLVFADADMEVAVRHSARQPLFLSGQGCVLPTRLLVEESIAKVFLDKVIAEVSSLKMGDPMDEATDLGPVVHFGAQSRLLSTIAKAKADGDGELLLGGRRPEALSAGAFVEATVFGGVKPQSSLAQNECFGPVISVIPFRTEDEAVEIANSTKFGLGAYIHSTDMPRTLRLVHRLHSGNVIVNGAATARENAPFGGLGLSGYGREGGRDGLQEYIRTKNVAIARI